MDPPQSDIENRNFRFGCPLTIASSSPPLGGNSLVYQTTYLCSLTQWDLDETLICTPLVSISSEILQPHSPSR